MELIDTHCHLDLACFQNDRDELVARAGAAGVTRWVNPSLHFKNIPTVLALSERYAGCYAAIGIYPRYSKDWQPADIEQVRQSAKHKKVVALGEIGLDYQFNIKSSRETQFAVLSAHLALAAELGLPVLLHNRDMQTYQDTLQLVAASPLAGRERIGVLHHFMADYDIACRALDLGLYLSFSAPVTYLNAKKMPALVKRLPLERIVIETDAPCMAPHPHRGTRNEPAYLRLIAESVAAIHRMSLEEIAEITTENASRLFALPR
jgi:TatD DNase family protein